MRYALHDLFDHQFEEFVVEICHEILGTGVQEFAIGPDGGRDAKFIGTAECFPSSQSPISGSTIIQAKHTSNPIAKYSDLDFSGVGENSVLKKEMPRIKNLVESGELDNYLLFSNRKLPGEANTQIAEKIKRETGAQFVHLFGIEAIERNVKKYPYLANSLKDFEYDMPLRASPDDLSNVIIAVVNAQSENQWPDQSRVDTLRRVQFAEKNHINGLSEEYAKMITRLYLKHFGQVDEFLSDPINQAILNSYREASNEFAAKLITHKDDFPNYDKLLNHLVELLIERDGDLKSNKRLTRVVYYYMYWNCDIGTTDQEAENATTY